jgi:hypothetical protein
LWDLLRKTAISHAEKRIGVMKAVENLRSDNLQGLVFALSICVESEQVVLVFVRVCR